MEQDPEREVKLLVHGGWNGEDAFGLALTLAESFPEAKKKVISVDFVKPDIEGLNWVNKEEIPDPLRNSTSKYLHERTDKVLSLKPEFYGLVELRQGDITNEDSFEKGVDVILVNGVLGQSVEKPEDIRKSLDNIWVSLNDGGRLYMDNSGYRKDEQREACATELKTFVDDGKFRKLEEGVYEKITPG